MRSATSHLFVPALIMLIASVCPQPTQATTICIDNATDLFNDLQLFSDGGSFSGDDLDIDLVIGSYKVGSATQNKSFTYYSTASAGNLSISGGWLPNCTEQVPGAHDVFIDGDNKAPALTLDDNLGSISVEQLVIQNGKASGLGAGLLINTNSALGGTVTVENCIIQNNNNSRYVGGLVIYASGKTNYIEVGNNLIINNSAGIDDGAGSIDGVSVYSMDISNNTVYGNSSASNAVGGLYISGTVPPESAPLVAGNIFKGNTQTGLYLDGTPAYVHYNDYGVIGGVAPIESIGNTSVAPIFVDTALGDFRLVGPSSLFGLVTQQGNCNVDADLDGHLRANRSACDPGAYEETVFVGDFEEH
jgi:hypothetical protein